jgi:glycosyltransferase involved in cell wall biosynthesis
MSVKITYIISDVDKAISFEWIVEELDKDRYALSFILLSNVTTELEQYLLKNKQIVKRITYGSKKDLIPAIIKIISILKRNKTAIVHTHLFNATFAGLISAKLCGIKKRIYTRHYSTLHYQYFPNAVKWDKMNNFLATRIVAISETVKKVLIEKENVDSGKITIIPHGFKLEQFRTPDRAIVARLKAKYNPLNKSPVIGVISRFTELKGVEYIITAFKKILTDYPNALILFFNAAGEARPQIENQLKLLPPESYKCIAFENEITSLYHLFNVFIHVPIDPSIEAFGQTYIECLASGTPLVATKSGIGNEILKDGHNSIIVPYKNSESIYAAVTELLKNKQLCELLTRNGFTDVENVFALNKMILSLEKLYNE